MLWYVSVLGGLYGGSYFSNWMVPPAVGAFVFILIGLYMMGSGTEKKGEREAEPLKQ
jgi:putative Mn2+ efflux pump MntP